MDQRVHQFAGAGFFQHHRHAGQRLPELPQHPRHEGMQGGRAGEADAQPALLPAVGAAHHLGHTRRPLQHGARLLQQGLPRRGEPHAARQPLDQLHAQFGLQALQQARQRRLLHAQALRGPRDVALLRDLDKGLESSKFQH